MSMKQSLTAIGQPVPELPVIDVERAQGHYRDALGFEIGWLYPGKEIGAVSRGDVAIFFRRRLPPSRRRFIGCSPRISTRSGAAVVGREDYRTAADQAVGIKAVHRRGPRRKSFLFSSRLVLLR